ncbi:MAG: NAD(P)/FAD-dependent oxidoreductase [Filomicrobium sp.]
MSASNNQSPDNRTYDAIIIGGGHNGLTTATYLAQAGLDVLVLERRSVVGGAAVTEEFHPGFRNSTASYTVSLLNPEVIDDLQLRKHGLRIVERPMANFWPVNDTRYLSFPYDEAARIEAISNFSKEDAQRFPAFNAALDRAAALLVDMAKQTPPNAGDGWLEVIRNAQFGQRMASLSVDDKRLLVDLFTKSAADFLNGWFENETVKAAFAFDGIVGAYAAPSTPGTAYVLLHHCFGEVKGKKGVWGHAIGGMGAITQAMAKSATASGATILTDASVAEVEVFDGTAKGVTLTDGREFRAHAIVANVGPKLLFSKLLPPGSIDDTNRNLFTRIKTGSGTFRMNVALSDLPNFTCHPSKTGEAAQHHGAGIIIGPSLDYLEQAYLDARQHGWSKAPIVEMLIPSTLDDTLAPPGKHVASLFIQHVAPHLPHGRSWEDPTESETFANLVIDTVTRYAPNFKSSILARQIHSPFDLEQKFGLVDGDIFHGQMGLDQLFSARPAIGYAAYRMPVKRLYLCGSGAHPGGGVTGLPGRNAAREVLKDFKRGKLA